MNVTAFNTMGAPQGDGYILSGGHAAWDNLGSTGANTCVIIAAWVPEKKKLALCHFDIFTNEISSVWSAVDKMREGSAVDLYMASYFFKQIATSTEHRALINWFDQLSYANSLQTFR